MIDAQQLKDIMAKNLNYYINKSGKNQTDISRELNIPETTMSNWIRGNTYPRTDKIQLLADYFGIRRSDLTEEHSSIGNNVTEIDTTNIRQVPILGTIACGNPILAEQNIEGYIYEFAETLPHGTIFGLIAKGDSMEPTIPNGATVLIREQSDVENGEIAAVLVNGDTEATLKRVKKIGSMVMLMPDNNKYDPIPVSEDTPARIIGKAIRVNINL